MPTPRQKTSPARICFVLCAQLVVTAGANSQQPSRRDAQGSFDTVARQIDELVGKSMSSESPGCVVGVDRGGERLTHSYGLADLEHGAQNDSNTVFEAGSVSKQFTAAAVLLLAHQGRLQLDDKVQKWIPELSALVPAITIRQLLNHQSGLRDWGDLVSVAGWPRGTRAFTQRDAVLLIARQRALNFRPGAEYSYSNSNYVIAAEIVARVSGQSFASFTHHEIFTPLGMLHTQWRDDFRRRVPHRATAWTADDSMHWMLDMPFEDVIGHAGLLTTANDLLRWNANFASGKVGGANFAAEMEQAGMLLSGRTTAYALGLELDVLNGAQVISHAGATAGFRSYLARIPAREISVALLCNNGSINTEELGPQLLQVVNGRASPESNTPRIAIQFDSSAMGPRPTGGYYRNSRTRRGFEISVSGDTLVSSGTRYFRAGSTYVTADGRRRVQPDTSASKSRLLLMTALGDTIIYDRVLRWTPTARELDSIAGMYRSADASAVWRITRAGNELRLSIRDGLEQRLSPMYAYAFEADDDGWIVNLRRDHAHHIVGLEAGSPRMRTLSFTRDAETRPKR